MRLVKFFAHGTQAPMMPGGSEIRVAVNLPLGLVDLLRHVVHVLIQRPQQDPSLRHRRVFRHAGMVAPFPQLFAPARGKSGNEPQQM